MPLQSQQALQIVGRSEDTDVRQARAHPACNWLIVFQAQQRIQPNEPAYPPLHGAQFRGQCTGLSGIPAVTQNQKRSITGSQLPAVELVELPKRCADVGAAGPPSGLLRQRLQRLLQTLCAEQTCDFDKIGAEQKRIGALKMFLQSVEKFHQKRTVRAHRAADVEQGNQSVRAEFPYAVSQIHGLATAADASPDCPSQVQLPSRCSDSPPSLQPPAHLLEQAKGNLLQRSHVTLRQS